MSIPGFFFVGLRPKIPDLFLPVLYHLNHVKFFSSMKKLLFPAMLAALLYNPACTPKTGTQTASTPVAPAVPAQYDTIGKPLLGAEPGDEPVEYNLMDEAVVEPRAEPRPDTLAPYNPSHTFENDLIHTKIEISFDWSKSRANGKATLTLRPWFYPTDKLTLDAKNFDIRSVTFEGKPDQLKYDYNNEQLVVHLGKTLTRADEYKVVIAYTAKPEEREKVGGSAAITSDKGLYFINADGSDATKPRQIWTQGETESNSFWFPTVDKPNERCTQEMYITVEDKYKTLSNGILVSSKKNADGTRTDYWKMDKPHAPYLFMMAIGEYAVVKDKWRGIDVDYYVEPKFEAYARDIYPYTTEMLEFFSTKLNYPYAWPKFSQVVVRDYVSGAMENTTAVIFGEFMQKTKRELLDDHLTNEKVVAHEMFHQWFGDLVTTESWANLTLNEGFANYSEYLWMEHKYNRNAADEHLLAEQQGYLFSASDGGHPLIHYGYDDREGMFDAHSYNKGGCVLHMLRTQVGDDAFFAALSRYLKKNEYTDVEVDELRLAFEDVTGQDLQWFFNQWYKGAGHPVLSISYNWDEAAKKMMVRFEQTQEASKNVPYVFDLPMAVDLYDASGKARRERIRVTKRVQTFAFDAAEKPALVNVDAEKTLICVKTDQHTPDEWAFMYRYAPLHRDRAEALDGLQGADTPQFRATLTAALQDKSPSLRQRALGAVDPKASESLPAVAKIAANDPEPGVRASAIAILGETGDAQYVPVLQKSLDPDQAYSVVTAGLAALTKLNPQAAIVASKSLENDENESIILALADLYAQHPDRAQIVWFQKHSAQVDNMAAFAYFDFFQRFIIGLNDNALLDESLSAWKNTALDAQASQWRRFASTKSIADVRNHFRDSGNSAKVELLEKVIEEIKEKETDPTLKLYYGMF